ncbi:hypothetical protein [Sinosporangium album]|uniref:hypothetical protein n=1 Tax=Sinosporangium album TaxID=504805 RepID=UPI003B83653E
MSPVYSAAEDRSHLLASCYRESLRVADELGARARLPRDLDGGVRLADGRRRPRRGGDGDAGCDIGD